MRNFSKRMLIVSVALAAVASTGIGSAAVTTCNAADTVTKPTTRRVIATQTGACVLEPLLSRSDLAPVYVNDADPDNLGEANLRSVDFQTSGTDTITVVVDTSERIPRNINEFPQVGTGPGVRAPYGGVHVLALFQTPQLGTTQVMGPTLSGGTSTFGPYNISDNYHFFFYYGITVSSGGNPSCGWGVYDQFGQLFSVFSQEFDNPKNYSCVNNGNTITFNFKYRTNWRLQPDNLARSVEIVKAGQTISSIKAFTWMDHEVGGPPPVGLVVGATHYTDVIPEAGYDFGAWVGDPNSGGIPGHTCSRYPIVGTVPNPLASGGACYISTGNTVGLGMRPTSLNVAA